MSHLWFITRKHKITVSSKQKMCQLQIFQACYKLWCFRDFASVFRPNLGSLLLSTYLLTTTKWTIESGQQQDGTMLAYISNGMDKQQKLPKRGPKTLEWSHKTQFQYYNGKFLKNLITQLLFHAVTCEVISCFLRFLIFAIFT